MIFTQPLKISALSSAIAQLSTVQEKLEEVHYEQATADFYYLSELIKDYIGLVGAVKDVFAVSFVFFSFPKQHQGQPSHCWWILHRHRRPGQQDRGLGL